MCQQRARHVRKEVSMQITSRTKTLPIPLLPSVFGIALIAAVTYTLLSLAGPHSPPGGTPTEPSQLLRFSSTNPLLFSSLPSDETSLSSTTTNNAGSSDAGGTTSQGASESKAATPSSSNTQTPPQAPSAVGRGSLTPPVGVVNSIVSDIKTGVSGGLHRGL